MTQMTDQAASAVATADAEVWPILQAEEHTLGILILCLAPYVVRGLDPEVGKRWSHKG